MDEYIVQTKKIAEKKVGEFIDINGFVHKITKIEPVKRITLNTGKNIFDMYMFKSDDLSKITVKEIAND